MSEFKSALDAAFGPGTIEAAQLKIDQLDGRPVSGHPHEPGLVPAGCLCRAEEPMRASTCGCAAEPVTLSAICAFAAELPVAAIAG